MKNIELHPDRDFALTLANTLGENIFTTRYSHTKSNAQDNLCSRTHYVDNDTLRYHASRVLGAIVLAEGALYLITESTALDYHKTRRGFRCVMFDLTGRSIYHPDLNDCHKSKDTAQHAFWTWYGSFDVVDHYRQVIAEKITNSERKLIVLRSTAADLFDEVTA